MASETSISSQPAVQQGWNRAGVIMPIIVAAVGITAMAATGYLLQKGLLPMLSISTFELVNFTFTMQLYVLPLSLAGILYIFLTDRKVFQTYFRFRLNKPPGSSDEWQPAAAMVAIAFTLGTTAFMAMNVVGQNGAMTPTFFRLFPLVLLFAVTNAWTEEILTRFVLVAGLSGKLPGNTICLVSAVIFGLPHFMSGPGGMFGVVAAGALGWFLAKSVLLTRTMGWAILFHFLLDVIVFGAGAMVVAGSVD